MDMRATLKSKSFWIPAIIVVIVFFSITIGNSKTFQVETRIMLLPKQDWSARNIEQIIGNAKQIPLSLSFYNKLLEKNSDIEDQASQLADAKRKQAWNSEISVERISKTGVVKIVTLNDIQLQAEILNKQTVDDLIFVMSKYYASADLDIRKIDGPIMVSAIKNNVAFGIAGISLVLGFVIGLLFQLLMKLFTKEDEIEGREEMTEDEKKPFTFPKFSFPDFGQNFGEKKALDFNVEEEAALVSLKKEKEIISGGKGKKSMAPANLPIAEEQFSFNVATQPEKKVESTEEIVSDAVSQDVTREATAEEVKNRLNKLLSGDLLK